MTWLLVEPHARHVTPSRTGSKLLEIHGAPHFSIRLTALTATLGNSAALKEYARQTYTTRLKSRTLACWKLLGVGPWVENCPP